MRLIAEKKIDVECWVSGFSQYVGNKENIWGCISVGLRTQLLVHANHMLYQCYSHSVICE